MSNRQLTTPEQLRDFCIGKALYSQRKPETDCTNDVQSMGWYKALCHDRGSRQDDSFAQVYHRNGVSVYHDLYAGWMDVETPDTEPVRVMFSESALEAASKRSVYEFDGLVNENVFA